MSASIQMKSLSRGAGGGRSGDAPDGPDVREDECVVDEQLILVGKVCARPVDRVADELAVSDSGIAVPTSVSQSHHVGSVSTRAKVLLYHNR